MNDVGPTETEGDGNREEGSELFATPGRDLILDTFSWKAAVRAFLNPRSSAQIFKGNETGKTNA